MTLQKAPKFILPLILCACLMLSMPIKANARTLNQDGPGSFADIVDDLLPAVVNISSTQKMDMPEDMPDLPQFPEGSPFQDFFEEFMERRHGMPSMPQASLGSGFVIDAENGYIITNNHVVKDAEEIRVTFQDDETLPAELIGTDEKTDLAVLKIDTKKKLTAVKFGNSDVLRVGDWIVAIGNPFGLGGTVTAGIISARQRDINAGPYDDFIQTDASINRGNSGGPMFDLKGEVIGINTAIFSPSGGSVGIGFAIPSALAKPVINQIIQYGRTRRGWLGVRIQQVTDEIAESLGVEKATGALIASITPGGPAEKAGLKAGDIILEFNSQKVSEMRELPRLVAEAKIDAPATITYWRDNKKATAKVTVGELEKAEEDGLIASGEEKISEGIKVDSVGLSLKKITDTMRRDYAIPPSVDGVAIVSVDPKSEAAQKGLFEGDIIVEINQTPVSDPEKAKEIIEKATENGRSSILLLINREDEVRFLALKLKKDE
ncbi:MAG: DegQ family serine endoprotease [Rhodospirillales bacterium]|nr:DegQ family serine endoprotease [Alphaproteobacteria bacterium]MCB9981408.1 DegQ family serine endoprotease [Rhodospirillales bacterium]